MFNIVRAFYFVILSCIVDCINLLSFSSLFYVAHIPFLMRMGMRKCHLLHIFHEQCIIQMTWKKPRFVPHLIRIGEYSQNLHLWLKKKLSAHYFSSTNHVIHFFFFPLSVVENTGEMQIFSLSPPLKLKQRVANIMITETKFQQIDQHKKHWLYQTH